MTRRNPTYSPPGEHSRRALNGPYDARKDWGDVAPFLDLPPTRGFPTART